MARQPGARIMGLETEFGCLVRSEGERPEDAVELVKDAVFYDQKLGVIDRQARDEVFEPAGSGGFLINGGRLYIDAVGSHLEYATPECQSVRGLVAADLAGRRIVDQAVHKIDQQDEISFFSNSVDHFAGHTFGCHENYLVKMDEGFFVEKAPLLYPFLVSRQIFAGVGRVGGHVLIGGAGPSYEEMSENPVDYIWVSNVYSAIPDNSVEYQLSQRADHILKTVAGRVRFNRALINPKWEHFYSNDGEQRLHMLFGEANMNPYASALKLGTTHLVLKMIEEEILTDIEHLSQPLLALRGFSRDTSLKVTAPSESGGSLSALDIQFDILEKAQVLKGESEENDWILKEWEATLTQLQKDPMKLGDKLDWVAKRQILEMFVEEEGLDWTDDKLHSLDMEYHCLDPDRSLYHAWRSMQGYDEIIDPLDVIDAMTEPPQNTRAKKRGDLVKQHLETDPWKDCTVDWSLFASESGAYCDLSDPFNADPPEGWA